MILKFKSIRIFTYILLLIFSIIFFYQLSKEARNSEKIKLMGGGSSFIYSAMLKWSNNYYEKTGVQISYHPIGSAGGQRQILAGIIDFAISDHSFSDEVLEKYNLVQHPIISGGVVPIVNIPSVKNNELILTGEILSNIYLGNIRYWDDIEIKSLNPNLSLPHTDIIPIHRADGSGTTYNFSNYLSTVSIDWKNLMGVDTSLSWSTGIGAKGNQGIAVQVQQIENSIGYVEYAYAKLTKINTAKMISSEGDLVIPNFQSFKCATIKESCHKNREICRDFPENKKWPIVSTVFVILPKHQPETTANALKDFFGYIGSKEGKKISKEFYYISL